MVFKKNPLHFKNSLESETLLFSKVYSTEKPFNKKLLKDHFHYCEKLFEDFIVYYVSQNNKEERLGILTDFYTEKNISKQALKTNAALISLIESYKINYKNNNKLFNHNLKKFNILLNDFSHDTFQYAKKALDYLDKYYFLEKLNLQQELHADSIMSNRTYDFKLLEEIKKEIKNDKSLSNNLLFKIYSITTDLYERKVDKSTYEEFKGLIIPNLNLFDTETIKISLSDISNYLSILYSKTADNSLLNEIFEIYKKQLEYKTIIRNGEIPDANFSQIIRVAMYLKEFEWANSFILNYGSFLNNEDLILLSKAEISYNQLNFDETLSLLNNVDLKTTKLNYQLKSLYAKVLYDTSEIELLENHLSTFEIYLRRQKEMSKLIRKNNLNFVLYFKRLINNIYNKQYLLRLKTDLEADKSVFNRNWLLIRIEKLL